jgi:hypothetical protein
MDPDTRRGSLSSPPAATPLIPGVEGAEPTERGKQPTKVRRVDEGNAPFQAVTTFPLSLRLHLEAAEAHHLAENLRTTSVAVYLATRDFRAVCRMEAKAWAGADCPMRTMTRGRGWRTDAEELTRRIHGGGYRAETPRRQNPRTP